MYYGCMCSFGKEIDASEAYCPGDKAIWCDFVKTTFYNKYDEFLFIKFKECLNEGSLANNLNENTKDFNELLEELKVEFDSAPILEIDKKNITKGFFLHQGPYGITKTPRNDRLDSLLFTEKVYIDDKNLNDDEVEIWKQCFKECLIKLGGNALLDEYEDYLAWLETIKNVLSSSFSTTHSVYNDLIYYSERLIRLCEEMFPLVSEKYYAEKKEEEKKRRREISRYKITKILKHIIKIGLVILVLYLLYHFLGC